MLHSPQGSYAPHGSHVPQAEPLPSALAPGPIAPPPESTPPALTPRGGRMLLGAIVFGVALAATIGNFNDALANGGSSYTIWHGAMAAGLVMFFRGLFTSPPAA